MSKKWCDHFQDMYSKLTRPFYMLKIREKMNMSCEFTNCDFSQALKRSPIWTIEDPDKTY